jgi:hypothetical protein
MHHWNDRQLERLVDKDLAAKEKWAATWDEMSVSVRHVRPLKKNGRQRGTKRSFEARRSGTMEQD